MTMIVETTTTNCYCCCCYLLAEVSGMRRNIVLRDNVLRLGPVYIQSKYTDAVVYFSIFEQRHRKATRISHTREYRRNC